MTREARITLEKAAQILGSDLESLNLQLYELGISIHHDKETGTDYISAADLEDLKERIGVLE